MGKFSDFNIKVANDKAFIGDKIKMTRILGKEIIVHHFKIGPSKIYKERGTCLCLQLQISLNSEKHIIFTSSSGLIDAIQQVPENEFPFTTIIMQENERFKFT